ncbi:YgjV family protein [Kushneria phosphatilytica]|uniref:YgjV family protein n=1 Tax=Kushneria phosphatilytica TaxID=657387 RepID=A0A1S1NY51_9GAMM|nr:YgjV family protein [Kushneria phosphatilytica]OHV12817.1 hypothetical protein BH688_01915 [Kushneria phosphatilytica]QEL10665.1 YgjV family protein [Kushneria phosphatilytica]
MQLLAGQIVSLIALAICLVAFASKRDDRLLKLLISANIAFTLQYLLFASWVAAAITTLVILRIVLARRHPGSYPLMAGVLAATLAVSLLFWEGWLDLLPLTAGVLGTIGMFMLRGIPMRLMLAGAALAWALTNLIIGAVGGTLAETLIFITNVITIARMARDRRAHSTA